MSHVSMISVIGAVLLPALTAAVAADPAGGPVRVFLLAGQSNMEGHA